MKKYPRPVQFDGAKFGARYGIDSLAGDFWMDRDFLYLRDGLVLPDDPPIFEAPDPPKPDRFAQLEVRVTALER